MARRTNAQQRNVFSLSQRAFSPRCHGHNIDSSPCPSRRVADSAFIFSAFCHPLATREFSSVLFQPRRAALPPPRSRYVPSRAPAQARRRCARSRVALRRHSIQPRKRSKRVCRSVRRRRSATSASRQRGAARGSVERCERMCSLFQQCEQRAPFEVLPMFSSLLFYGSAVAA